MEAIVVGDLHGNILFYEKIRNHETGKVIIVGDLLDSRTFTRAEQCRLLEKVLDDIEDGLTDHIFGNHELSYLIPRMRCSGYASSFDAQIMPLKNRMWKLMKPYILDKENGVLISHAGLSQKIYPSAGKLDMDVLEEWLFQGWRDPDHNSLMFNVGQARFGPALCGGMFWCDWNTEFDPIPGLTQIFGHTPVGTITRLKNNWNLDCVEYKKTELAVKLTGKKVEIINYETIQGETPGGSTGTAGTGKQTYTSGTIEEAGSTWLPSPERARKTEEEIE